MMKAVFINSYGSFNQVKIGEIDKPQVGGQDVLIKMKTVIDSTFPLDKIIEAFQYSSTGRVQGKIIITMES